MYKHIMRVVDQSCVNFKLQRFMRSVLAIRMRNKFVRLVASPDQVEISTGV